jgi:Ca2+-binding RTX toxin-like protein
MRRRPPFVRIALAFAALTFTLGIAVTSTNVVPASRAGSASEGTPTANELKPSTCGALNLSLVRVVSGKFSGSAASELIIGSPGDDTLRGGNGNDCVLGGSGDDSLRGDGGTDVCIGGPGADTFDATCETQIQ